MNALNQGTDLNNTAGENAPAAMEISQMNRRVAGPLSGNVIKCLVLLLAFICPPSTGYGADLPVLDAVRERGYVRCGVNDMPAYAGMRNDGSWSGFQVDFCRAIAASIFDNPEAIEIVVLYTDDRFTSLIDNEVDVLLANVTWTLERETSRGLAFTDVLVYDGQGVISHPDSGLRSLMDAAGRDMSICVVRDTTTEFNIREINNRHKLGLEIRRLETFEGVWNSFLSRQCELVTGDGYSLRLHLPHRTSKPERFTPLPDILSREPLTPAVRAGDSAWESLVRWVRHALIIAEEKGVTSENAAAMAQSSTDPETRRLLGSMPGIGKYLGLTDTWARQAIMAVGNYSEMFDRNIGAGSIYKLERGQNALWRDGGLLYAPPLR